MKSTERLEGKLNIKKVIVIFSLLVLVFTTGASVGADESAPTRITGAGVVLDETTGMEQKFGGAALATGKGETGFAGMWTQNVLSSDGVRQVMCECRNITYNESTDEVVIWGHVFPETGERCNVVFQLDSYHGQFVGYEFLSAEVQIWGTVMVDHVQFAW